MSLFNMKYEGSLCTQCFSFWLPVKWNVYLYSKNKKIKDKNLQKNTMNYLWKYMYIFYNKKTNKNFVFKFFTYILLFEVFKTSFKCSLDFFSLWYVFLIYKLLLLCIIMKLTPALIVNWSLKVYYNSCCSWK